MDGIENTTQTITETNITNTTATEVTNQPGSAGTEGTTNPETEPTVRMNGDNAAQDAETNRRNAAARRKAEQEQRFADMQRDYERKLKDAERSAIIAATGGKVNPYTGKLIETKEELEDYNRSFKLEDAKRKLEKSGLDPEALSDVISQHPMVRNAQKATEDAKRANLAAAQQLRKKLIDEDIAKISEIDPSITSLDDLLSSSDGEEIEKLQQTGRMTYLEAYKQVTYDRVANVRAAAAGKAAAEKAGSKAHMEATSQKSGDVVTIPTETLAMYRNLGFSEEQARKHYVGYLKSTKG